MSVHALPDNEAADLSHRHAHLRTHAKGAHDARSPAICRWASTPYWRKKWLIANGAAGALARDELLAPATRRAHPNQAALASASGFAIGASIPIFVTMLVRPANLRVVLPATALISLALPGGSAAHSGGARVTTGALRVAFWGILAMALMASVGTLFGSAVQAGTPWMCSAAAALGSFRRCPWRDRCPMFDPTRASSIDSTAGFVLSDIAWRIV